MDSNMRGCRQSCPPDALEVLPVIKEGLHRLEVVHIAPLLCAGSSTLSVGALQ